MNGFGFGDGLYRVGILHRRTMWSLGLLLAACCGQTELTPSHGPPHPAEPTAAAETVTPHPQRDAPVKIETITQDMLRQAGATHAGQAIQDVPGIQSRH